MSDRQVVDVLVVGAGPTGLMLANQLVRRGASVHLVEQNAGPSVQTKALGVQARTLEIYAQLGLAERAVALGRRAVGATMWAGGRRAARVPLGDIGRDLSPFPFLLILGQDDNERLLGEALAAAGGRVAWNTQLLALQQAPEHVRATLRQPDGSTREVQARWLAGCDGARSSVRAACGIDFVGAPYEHVFFVADTRARGPMVPGELNVSLWAGGFHLFFPMRGEHHWRVVGILPPALRGRADVGFAEVAPTVGRELMAADGADAHGQELRFDACHWFSTYRIHHRRAERFRAGRCFLLGDAAHIHSPVGAQGMNTGLVDAHNLAWKLALVAAGRAGEALLDTFAAEREPVADRLLATTDRAFSLVVSDSWWVGQFRTRVMPRLLALAMKRESARRLAFRTISQIGIRHPRSPLSVTLPEAPRGGPRAGDRFPWLRLAFLPTAAPGPSASEVPVSSSAHAAASAGAEDVFRRFDDLRFHLLVIGQAVPPDIARGCADLLELHAARESRENTAELARVGIRAPAFYLLRPDGYVTLAGGRLEAAVVRRHLEQRLALRWTPAR